MSNYNKEEIKEYIKNGVEFIEHTAERYIGNDEIYSYIDIPIENLFVKIGGKFELINLDFYEIINKYNSKSLYDVKFSIKHTGTIYTFETSNYRYYPDDELIVEDLLENISELLRAFKCLLENESLIFDDDDEEDDSDGYGVDYYIDDDGNWEWIDREYTELDLLKFNIKIENDFYIYDDEDENGKFYWK